MKILRVIFVIAVLCGPFYAQQVNQDIVPASPGLYLGHTNQRWNGYFNNADIYNLTINGSPIGTAGIGLPQISIPNGTNCTTLNGLVEFDGNGQAQTASLSSTKVIGVAVSGAGCSGNVLVQYAAIVNCTTDGSTLINDRIAASNSIPGDCMDIGPISIPGIQTVGLVTAVSSGAGQLTSFDLFTGDTISPSSSSGSGVVSVSPCVGPFGYAATASAIVSWDCNTSLDGSGNAGFKKVTVTGSGAGKIDFGSSTTPGNPSAGFFRLYADSGTGFLTCLTSTGANCLSSGTAFSAITSGTNTAAAMIVGTGSSLKPLNVGQVAGSQAWMSPGLVAPAMTAGATSSGSLLQIHSIVTEVTYNTASGETLPSSFTQIATNAAGCASNCSVTVTAPTLASGFTGYSVYACEINSGTYPGTACSSPATLVRLASCTNITINCVITVTPSGATQPPTTLTAWIQPPNIQPATLVPLSGVPSLFFPKADGNYYPLAGMDYSAGSPLPSPDGTFSFWHRVFINDTGLNISQGSGASGPMKNNLVAIAHLVNGNTTGTGNTLDDRALGVKIMLPTTATGTANARIMGIYGETWIQGNPTQLGTAPDDGAKGLRWNLADNRTGGSISGGFGAIEGQYSNQTGSTGNFGSCDPCAYGVSGGVTTGNAAINFGGANFASVFARGIGSSAGTSGDGWAAFYAGGPSVAGHSGNAALLQRSAGGTWPTGVNDYFLRSDISGSQSIFLGTLNLPSIQSNGPALPVTGSVAITGALNVTGFTTVPTGTVSCTTLGGATQFFFKTLGVDSNGGTISSASLGTAATCNSNITAVNTIIIQPPSVTAGIARYDFYFTNAGGGTCNGGACTLGKIGSCTPVASALSRTGGCSGTTTYTGAAGDGVTAPLATNSTGGMQAVGLVRGGNTVQLASDFTSAANTSLQTIGALSWTVSGAAAKYSFHCSLMYSQATAAVAMQFGIQAATVAPNDISAKGRVDTSTSAQTSGVLSNLATTTATSIVTFTPSATATVFGGDLDGTIDLPANGAGNVLNIMVQTSNSADLPTVKRGSYCQLF